MIDWQTRKATMQLLSELTHPILQAPIGSAASVDLAAAVAGAGGMGCLAMTWTEPEIAVQQVRRLRQTTD
jgi:NAD(P)H-dependent flavin oxidoreductase YrpB (nitropropane dioxygenase family)